MNSQTDKTNLIFDTVGSYTSPHLIAASLFFGMAVIMFAAHRIDPLLFAVVLLTYFLAGLMGWRRQRKEGVFRALVIVFLFYTVLLGIGVALRPAWMIITTSSTDEIVMIVFVLLCSVGWLWMCWGDEGLEASASRSEAGTGRPTQGPDDPSNILGHPNDASDQARAK